jgi:hypothetical protein
MSHAVTATGRVSPRRRAASVPAKASKELSEIGGCVGVFLTGCRSNRQFRRTFLVTAAAAFVGAILFLILASGERQVD